LNPFRFPTPPRDELDDAFIDLESLVTFLESDTFLQVHSLHIYLTVGMYRLAGNQTKLCSNEHLYNGDIPGTRNSKFIPYLPSLITDEIHELVKSELEKGKSSEERSPEWQKRYPSCDRPEFRSVEEDERSTIVRIIKKIARTKESYSSKKAGGIAAV
jgi:hypothetical protein